jgi:hypothetical protein
MGPDRTGMGLTESAACVVLAQDDVHHKLGIPPMGTQPWHCSGGSIARSGAGSESWASRMGPVVGPRMGPEVGPGVGPRVSPGLPGVGPGVWVPGVGPGHGSRVWVPV